jgi:Extensin-like protein C-terminus
MTRGVRLYLVGSFVLVSLVGCGRGFFSEEREPWRTEAEIACLKSGAVRESADVVRMSPISGPGVCGAEYPLKVGAFGEGSGTFGFADDDLRPPAPIGNQPRWPIGQPASPAPAPYAAPPPYYRDAAPRYGSPANAPISLSPPGIANGDIDSNPLPAPAWRNGPAQGSYSPSYSPRDGYAPSYPERGVAQPASPGDRYRPPRLGPGPDNSITAAGPVTVKPAATLACPIVSALDRWLAESVQPSAMRWFGARVIEIRQISAYSCRGMNGHSWAHISEHAFGNALDISAFTLADGRQISVRDGWRGLPQEQGFLRDIEASACRQFTTVLAPGSNAYHHDHIHVDLMRRASLRQICEPAAVSGEEVAAHAARRNPYASRESFVTGSLDRQKHAPPRKAADKVNEEDEFEDE